MIKAEIVADSLSPQGDRLVSVLCTFPRIILAEVNTHRMLSKNTASSRAIPFTKMVQSIEDYPFIPIAFQKDHKGMQGTEYFEGEEHDIQVKNVKYRVMRRIEEAKLSASTGLTKQLVNRSLEEFMWTTMLITGPLEQGWDNFFNLRCPIYKVGGWEDTTTYKSWKDVTKNSPNPEHTERASILERLSYNKGAAEIHMMALAEAIWDAFNESTPKQLKAGDWHIPFENKLSWEDITAVVKEQLGWDYSLPPANLTKYKDIFDAKVLDTKVKVSTSMGARTSYTVIGEEKSIYIEEQVKLHDRLIAQNPPHSSPMEHAARCMNEMEYDLYVKGSLVYKDILGIGPMPIINGNTNGWCRNFRGFIPYRHIIETNART